MSSSKIAISIDPDVLKQVDALVQQREFSSRSRAIQEAVKEKLERLSQNLLAQECNKLDPEYEQVLAEEGMAEDLAAWPKY